MPGTNLTVEQIADDKDFIGRDLMYEGNGNMRRGLIIGIRLSPDKSQIEFMLGWAAEMNIFLAQPGEKTMQTEEGEPSPFKEDQSPWKMLDQASYTLDCAKISRIEVVKDCVDFVGAGGIMPAIILAKGDNLSLKTDPAKLFN